jgi:DNA polymerase-4
MSGDYNHEKPLVMHVDLNSAFATIEQQSRPLLRGKSVAIVNRLVENTSIVTASYEAKALGLKVGMKYREAKRLIPDLIALESDPAKYRYVYKKLMGIMNDYSPHVVMKSIDEGVMDFHKLTVNRPLVEIGYEIKQRLRDEIGSVMRCNIGIGPNRFLAKTAAGLHKPDGFDVIDANNLRATYEKMKLTDLTGIASQMEKRLNAVGIYTPIQFLDTESIALEKIVFKSICGNQWYKRLRGYEVDDNVSTTKTIGRQYVLENRNITKSQIADRLHNLCESVGSRMRAQGLVARGVFIYIRTLDRRYWHASKICQLPFFSDITINTLAQQLFAKTPDSIMEIGVRLYELSEQGDEQISLFNDMLVREQQLVNAVDEINQRFGDRTVHAASTLDANKIIKQKISFGSTRYL